MDYVDLKVIVKIYILDLMDYVFIYDFNSLKESKVVNLLIDLDLKVYGILS